MYRLVTFRLPPCALPDESGVVEFREVGIKPL